MKYFVIATTFDRNKGEQVKRIIGEFDDVLNACIFREAYNSEFKSDAKVVDEFNMFN